MVHFRRDMFDRRPLQQGPGACISASRRFVSRLRITRTGRFRQAGSTADQEPGASESTASESTSGELPKFSR